MLPQTVPQTTSDVAGAGRAGNLSESHMSSPSAAWYPDPSGRHQWRWWDGAAWTASVADDGEVAVDEIVADPGVVADQGVADGGEVADPAVTAPGPRPADDPPGSPDPVSGAGAVPFASGFPVLLVRRDDGPRGAATAGAVVAGMAAGPDPPGGPAGEVLAALEIPATAAPLGRGVADVLAGARVVVRDATGTARLTVTRPDARPLVVVTDGPPAAASLVGTGPAGFTATRLDDGRRRSIELRGDGVAGGRLEPEDLLGRRWILADSGPRATVHRRISREADRRRWAAVEYEVRAEGPAAAPTGPPALDAATLWVVGAVLALDLLDTQLPDRDD
jgi:hypothetical protein